MSCLVKFRVKTAVKETFCKREDIIEGFCTTLLGIERQWWTLGFGGDCGAWQTTQGAKKGRILHRMGLRIKYGGASPSTVEAGTSLMTYCRMKRAPRESKPERCTAQGALAFSQAGLRSVSSADRRRE